MASEKTQITISYLVNFYNEIETLLNDFSSYSIFLYGVKSTYSENDLKRGIRKPSAKETQQIEPFIQRIKFYVNKTYIRFRALKNYITDLEKDKKLSLKLTEVYTNIMKRQMPEQEDVEQYVISINQAFADSIIQDALQSLSVFENDLSGIYGKQEE